MSIKGVLFDLDGVLIDSEFRTLTIKKQMFEEYGLHFQQEWYPVLAGCQLATVFEQLFPDYPNPEVFLKQYHQRAYLDPNLNYAKLKMAQADEILTKLKEQKISIGLVTASNRKKIQQVLADCQWEDYFDVIISGEDGYPRKPSGVVYQVAMERLGLSPQQVAIVEDSTNGLLAAKAAKGLVICRKEARFPIDQSVCDRMITDLGQISTIIEEFNKKM